jgi:hypothetical protein
MRSVNTPTDSHAKNAKVAKNCNEKRVQNPTFAGPLGDLGALGVMRAASHAKNAKSAKEYRF